MKNFVCWDRGDIRSLENLDADALDDAFFQAVHTDFMVQIAKGKGENATKSSISPTNLISEILNQQTHAIVPIIGPAGSGKSHLVRWLSLKLRDRVPISEIIYVPKARTNLREILLLLVQRLSYDQQGPYLAALQSAGAGHLNKHAQRVAILANMQIALENDLLARDKEVDQETEKHCVDGLKAIMADPHLRADLVRDSGFVHQIATHVFDPPDRAHYQQPTERREFQVSDLPIRGGNLQHAAASTRSFIADLVGMPELQAVCARVVNRNLDWVITTCLNISGDRLVTLMTDLRAHFVQNGRDQIFLFIEDFARLQGVDRALMQSIIQSTPGVLRTVFACTAGFYNDLRDTVISRTEFFVELGTPSTTATSDVVSFVAKYMNAMRWGREALNDQRATSQRDNSGLVVGNKCDACEHRDDCHSSFGTSSGIGLYPFNETAVTAMALRSGASADNGFNPRNFLRGALRPVLEQADDIAEGRFPTERLYEHLGQTTITAATIERLKRADPLSWKRRRTLIEFWGGNDSLVNLRPGVHAAFSLPTLAGVKEEADRKDIKPVPLDPSEPTEPRQIGEVFEIERWGAGEIISAATVTKLRTQIFNALAEYIDWDEVGLSPTPFLDNVHGIFKQAQITFPRAATEQSANAFRLMIEPSDANGSGQTQLVLALQGLLESERFGHWGFADGMEKLSALSEVLESWSTDLVARFRALENGPGKWNPCRDAFMLLAIRQLAFVDVLEPLTEERVLAIVLSPPQQRQPNFNSPELNKIMMELSEKASQLQEFVKARLSLMKGARTGGYIDPTTIRDLLKSFAAGDVVVPRHWAEVGGDAVLWRRLARGIAKGWLGAVKAEQDSQATFNDTLATDLGEASSVDDMTALTTTIVERAQQVEVLGAKEIHQKWLTISPSWGLVCNVVLRSGDEVSSVRLLNQQIGKELEACNGFLRALEQLVGRTEAAIIARLDMVGIDPQEKDKLLVAFKVSLQDIATTLSKLGSHDTA